MITMRRTPQRPRFRLPAMRNQATIIDSHCHAGKGDGLTGPWDTNASLDSYLRRASRADIALTVLLPAFHSNYREANHQIAGIVTSDPQRFYGYAMVHPERDAGQIAEIVREAVEGYGFCGIKVHRHDARITREICEVARAHRMPVLYDVMGETSVVELLATEYPDVNFIIPHLGSFADDWRAHMALIDQLVRHTNIYTDTAGVRRFDFLVDAIRRAGPGKVLYGSDGPWLHPGLELAKVRMLGLPRAAEELVLSGNFLRLISRVRRVPSTISAWSAAPPPRPMPSDPWAISHSTR
jgi:predicted TIM-barrel fold metal-dependent hydrolase